MGRSQQQHQPTNLCPESGTPVSFHPISGISTSWKSSMNIPGPGASSRPQIDYMACSVSILNEPQLKSASKLFFWEWVASFTALTELSYWRLSVDLQKATKLAMKLHAHSVQYACKLVSTRCALEELVSLFIFKVRNGAVLVTVTRGG